MSFPRLSNRVASALIAFCFISVFAPIANAQMCPFDDGNSSLAVEGLILTRYALGITGAPLLAGTGVNAVDAPTVEAAINCPSCGLNITGNATLTVADATIISRKLAGFSGDALTSGLALGSGTRNTPAAVQSFLLSGCGATGGTVTSITAGSGLTGGTITGSGTIAVNTAVIQNRVSGTCVVGSSIRAIAADGNVTCQTDTSGGTGTVTNVATGLGLTGGPVTSTGTIAADTNYLQRRVSASCAVGSSIRAIAADGTVTCQTDTVGGAGTVTSVGGGIGINGGPVTSTGALSIAPSLRLPQTCTNGQFTRYNNASDTWDCVTPVVVTSVETGPGLTGGPITSAGTVGLASTQLLPTTACANGEITKWNGTAWACAAAASSGSVTSVATGPGLTGGPITSTGTVNLAATQLLPTVACTTDQIIKWNGSAWVCTSSLLTLPTACLQGQVLGLSTTGSVQCVSLPSTSSTAYNSTLNNLNSFGFVATVGLDGLPVMGFVDEFKNLVVVKCGNPTCNEDNTTTVVVSGVVVAAYQLGIAMPADGNPVISYASEPSLGAAISLRALKCGNALCSSGNVDTSVDATVTDIGRNSAISISPVDGFPIISYFSTTGAEVKVAKCGNATCNAGNTLTSVAAAGTFLSTAIAVRANGNPLVAYKTTTNTWGIVNCGNPQCSSGNTTPSFDSLGSAASKIVMLIPADGLPILSYGSLTGILKLAKCGDANCGTGNTYRTLSTSVSTSGLVVAIALSSDGFPVVHFAQASNPVVLKCGNASCSSGNTSTSPNSMKSFSLAGAMAIPPDGRPLIAYADTDSNPHRVRVLKCADAGCGNP
jgi:hypothetical protein